MLGPGLQVPRDDPRREFEVRVGEDVVVDHCRPVRADDRLPVAQAVLEVGREPHIARGLEGEDARTAAVGDERQQQQGGRLVEVPSGARVGRQQGGRARGAVDEERVEAVVLVEVLDQQAVLPGQDLERVLRELPHPVVQRCRKGQLLDGPVLGHPDHVVQPGLRPRAVEGRRVERARPRRLGREDLAGEGCGGHRRRGVRRREGEGGHDQEQRAGPGESAGGAGGQREHTSVWRGDRLPGIGGNTELCLRGGVQRSVERTGQLAAAADPELAVGGGQV